MSRRTPIAEMHRLASEDGEPRVRFKIEVANGDTCMTLEHPGYLRWSDLDLSSLEKFVAASRAAHKQEATDE